MVNDCVRGPAAAATTSRKGRRVVPGRRRVEAVNAAVDALVAHRCKSSTRRPAVALSDTLHVCVRTHDSAVLVAAALSRAPTALCLLLNLRLPLLVRTDCHHPPRRERRVKTTSGSAARSRLLPKKALPRRAPRCTRNHNHTHVSTAARRADAKNVPARPEPAPRPAAAAVAKISRGRHR